MYPIIRIFVRLALRIYCPHILVNDKCFLDWKGPLILASNHPNSFLDAVIIASLIKRPVHFLAYGEVVKRYFGKGFISALKLIPVFRMKDNYQNQEPNERSFSACVDILLDNGVILIFSEGTSENNWKLRPLKKATGRIAITAMSKLEMQSGLRILPVGLNYNSFTHIGKRVLIQFGETITYRDLETTPGEVGKINMLGHLLSERLSFLVLQTETNPEKAQIIISNCRFPVTGKLNNLQNKMNNVAGDNIYLQFKKPGFFISNHHSLGLTLLLVLILAIPATLGLIFHVLLYFPLRILIKKRTSKTVYFDSVFFTSLLIIYPIYWAGWNIFGYYFLKEIWLRFLLAGMPILAWVAVIWKENWQRLQNYFMAAGNDREKIKNYFY